MAAIIPHSVLDRAKMKSYILDYFNYARGTDNETPLQYQSDMDLEFLLLLIEATITFQGVEVPRRVFGQPVPMQTTLSHMSYHGSCNY